MYNAHLLYTAVPNACLFTIVPEKNYNPAQLASITFTLLSAGAVSSPRVTQSTVTTLSIIQSDVTTLPITHSNDAILSFPYNTAHHSLN